jgi:hypothetical protein
MQTAAVENGSRFSASGQKNAKCQIFLQKTLAMRQSLWYYN